MAPAFFFHGIFKSELGIKDQSLAVAEKGDVLLHHFRVKVFVFCVSGINKNATVLLYSV